MAKILVTGGLGFIGSHTVVELYQSGHEVVIVDNLSNTSISVLDKIAGLVGKTPAFEKVELRNKDEISKLYDKYGSFDGVIHFAAYKAVGESVEVPLDYYENNIGSLVHLLKQMLTTGDDNFIFSSSCTVYGQVDELPINEDAPVVPAFSPYGNTKQIGEEVLRDAVNAHDLNVIALRYFNPIGAHPSAAIGELPLGVPLNLVPFVTQTGAGVREELSVFGDDYDTRDGTCIRDYIHVVDIAKAHVVALERLMQGKNDENYEVFNLGTGTGSTVLEVIKAFEKVSGMPLKYKIVGRRSGDVTAAYADTRKANEVLGWKASLSLEDAMSDAWRWEQKIRSSAQD